MIHEITIRPVLNGFFCTVGCQAVVFESIAELVLNLSEYLKDPEGVEKKYRFGALNAKHMKMDRPCEAPPPRRDNECFAQEAAPPMPTGIGGAPPATRVTERRYPVP